MTFLKMSQESLESGPDLEQTYRVDQGNLQCGEDLTKLQRKSHKVSLILEQTDRLRLLPE